MAFRHEVLHIRRQKQPLNHIPGPKILAHSPSLNQTPSELNSDYSDRLLDSKLTNRRGNAQLPSLRANGPRECAPDHRLREAFQEAQTKYWKSSGRSAMSKSGRRFASDRATNM